MTHLRQLMLDELQRRNYSPSTVRCYIHAVEEFSKHFHRSPERLGPSHIREYQVHLFRDRKLSPGTIQSRCAALRFLFVKTLRRPYLLDEIPLPKRPRKLPAVLNPEEVARLIDSARNLMHRTMLMTLYATGLRRAELCHLKVTDIDSKRMVVRVEQGKGSKDRYVMLSPYLLTLLRQWWKELEPEIWLFPSYQDRHMSGRQLHRICQETAKQAGIKKRVSPHTLRHNSECRIIPRSRREFLIHIHHQ